jgi:predicted deacylase
VQWSYAGVMRILGYLDMFDSELSLGCPLTIICSRGFWMYTSTGGVLEVYPGVNTVIRKGDLIARIKDIFGRVVEEVFATHGGVVRIID